MEDDKDRIDDPVHAPADDPEPRAGRSDRERGDRADRDRSAEDGEPGASGRFMRFTRRFLDRRELTDDARVLLGAVLDTSDRAKTEMVRMAAREVRTYLNELKLTEGLMDLATSHSLEINASFHLKPLAPERQEPPADQGGGAADQDDDET